MKSDHYFEIGSTHDVCQDYAISGKINNEISYAIVADGCSMSHDVCGQVDFGARIIAHLTKTTLINKYQSETSLHNISKEEIDAHLQKIVPFVLKDFCRYWHLPSLFADATLLIAIADNCGFAYTFAYGDGAVFVQTKEGEQHALNIDFESGAPFYLSYLNSPLRLEQYRNQFGNENVWINWFKGKNANMYRKSIENITPKDLDFEARPLDFWENAIHEWENIDLVSVMSDGVNSFFKMNFDDSNSNSLSYIDVIIECNNLKNRNGVFMQRRIKSMKRKHSKENVYHYDDFSISSILTG